MALLLLYKSMRFYNYILLHNPICIILRKCIEGEYFYIDVCIFRRHLSLCESM